MNFRKMLKQNFKLNLEQYCIYIFSMIISVTFFFTESTLYNSYAMLIGEKNIFVIPSIAVFNTALWSIFTYISFIRYRQKEFTTFLTLGMTSNELKMLIFIENILIFLIYVPIGLTLGILFSKIIVLFVFKLVGISTFTFQFKLIVCISTLIQYVLLTVILILWTFKFINNLSELKLITYKNLSISYSQKEKLVKILIFILIISYIYFNERLCINSQSRYYIDCSLICIIIIFLSFLTLIKTFIVFFKKSKNSYYKKILLVNEIEDSLKDNKTLIFFITFLNFTFIINDRIHELPNVKTFLNTTIIFQRPYFNLIYVFILLLSFIASATTLYFKIKINFYNWQFKKITLFNIGLTDEEINTLLIYKLRLIFFSHVFLTVLTSIIYIYILNINKSFLISTTKLLICYFIVQLLGYIITKNKIIESI